MVTVRNLLDLRFNPSLEKTDGKGRIGWLNGDTNSDLPFLLDYRDNECSDRYTVWYFWTLCLELFVKCWKLIADIYHCTNKRYVLYYFCFK